jgi:Raf kinase inhibitor-like YbhB/YbcL family protein
MRFRLLAILLAFLAFAAAGARAADGGGAAFRVESPAFAPNGSIPDLYTCKGKDISPPIKWAGMPKSTASLALIVDDPDAPDPAAPKKTWVHWVLYNIPSATAGLPEGLPSPLPGIQKGANDWAHTGYDGPCPPIGRHRYFFKLYALDTMLDLEHPPSKEQLEEDMQGHVVAQATMIGTYDKMNR